MTPKEKAINIFNKCCDYADYTDEDCCFTERETMYKNAKALSLIFVNEILEICPLQNDWYWEEVKQELEKIEICENDVFKLPKKYTEKHLKYAYEQGYKQAQSLQLQQTGVIRSAFAVIPAEEAKKVSE